MSTNTEDVKDIDLLVRNNLPQKLPEGYKLARIERDDPYFKFYYVFNGKEY